MTNEDLCILAQSGNADAESELIDHLLPSLKALAAKFEAQYSGLQVEADDLLHDRLETAAHFHLSDSRAKSIERTALHRFREELHW